MDALFELEEVLEAKPYSAVGRADVVLVEIKEQPSEVATIPMIPMMALLRGPLPKEACAATNIRST